MRVRPVVPFAVLLGSVAVVAVACGGSSDDASASNPHGGGGAGGAGAGDGGDGGDGGPTDGSAGAAGDGSLLQDTGGSCPTGQACGDGGVCAANVCCDAQHACGDACCASGDVCSFQKCVTPGAECADESDCAAGEYCERSLGQTSDAGAPEAGADATCVGGNAVATGKCLPKPPECAPDAGDPDGGPLTCLSACEWHPPTNDFTPVVKYAWGGDTTPPTDTDVMMTPIVVELDDDDCDGKVTADDIPEIAFVTFSGGKYYGQGTLHVVSVVGGQVEDKWSAPNAVQGSSGLAAGDLDGDGVAEIVACMAPPPGGMSCCDATAYNTGVVAFKADGTVLWQQTDTSKVHCGADFPAIADPEGTGHPLVLVGLTLLDGATGAVVKELDPATGWSSPRIAGFSDIDGDGKLDVVDGQRVYRTDGSVVWDLRTGPDAIPFGYHAVGDLDHDGTPEVVVVSSSAPHLAYVLSYDAASPSGAKVVRGGIDINDGLSTATICGVAKEYGGGPPTIADFDGDGTPDIGLAGAVGYIVLDGKKVMDASVTDPTALTLWFKQTHDCSSAVTGSSVFDFNGDGKAEVVYSDEYHLWMYDGPTGQNLIPSTCNTTGTLWEYPVVADVDNDGQADIVVASNAYGVTCPDDGSRQSGIRIFGSASGTWVRTRRVWNQHTYHVTNVNEDGTIPTHEKPNWTVNGLDDYRQNKQPGNEFAAPDAIVNVGARCTGEYGLVATVRNVGQAALPSGVGVGFYAGTSPNGAKLGEGATTKVLYPAESEQVFLALPNADPGVKNGTTPVYAVVLDPSLAIQQPTVHECRADNDESASGSGKCGGIN